MANIPTVRQRLVAEALGTGLLVLAVVGSGIAATRLTDDVAIQLLANSAATAAALIALITALGPVSGAHFNPAVSLVARLTGDMTTVDSALYTAAQLTGGCIGALVANVMFDLPAGLSETSRSSGALWLSELIATFGLILVIHGTVRTGRGNHVAVTVGLWIGGAYWFTSSTSFANPAVTVARSFTDSFSGIQVASVPMFIVMQLAGAALAVPVVRLLYPTPTQTTS